MLAHTLHDTLSLQNLSNPVSSQNSVQYSRVPQEESNALNSVTAGGCFPANPKKCLFRARMIAGWQRCGVRFPQLRSRPFWTYDQLREMGKVCDPGNSTNNFIEFDGEGSSDSSSRDYTWVKELESKDFMDVAKMELEGALRVNSDSEKKFFSKSFASVGGDHRSGGHGAHDSHVVAGGEWTEAVLFEADMNHMSGPGEEGGTKSKSKYHPLFPKTSKLIESLVPEAVEMARSGWGEIIISKLAPRSAISAHCAPNNTRLTVHLGLKVPRVDGPDLNEITSKHHISPAWIRVGPFYSTWEEGKCMIFDDSYEHEVRNNSVREERVVRDSGFQSLT